MDSLLLLIIIWLLWTISQDLKEANQRQRHLKSDLEQLKSASAKQDE